MGIWDRFGRGSGTQPNVNEAANDADEQAIARYRYMLKTAPPETIEQAHAEAFAALTPEQRRKMLQRLSEQMPESERAAVARAGDSPGALAQAATRAEIRQPGAIERAFGGVPGQTAGPGFGSMVAGGLLGSMAGTVLGSMVAQHFFSGHPEAQHLFADTTASHDFNTNADQITDATDIDPDIAPDFGGIDTWDV